MKRHRQLLNEISSKVKQYHAQKKSFRISHGSTNSTRNPHNSDSVINVGELNSVIEVDMNRKVVKVEPNVPMDQLVKETLKFGLIPPVVMEFPGITVGGGYSGTSGESSSFKHGFFDETINEVEFILGNGDIIQASPKNEHSDLFHGAAGAVGSLGITTLVELQLIDAKPFVETTYHFVTSIKEAKTKIHEACGDENIEYVDGIMYSTTKGAIITGRLIDEKDVDVFTNSVQTFSNPIDPWFYMHVEEEIDKLDKKKKRAATEIVPLSEYLFRYDRGGFWVGDSAFKYTMVPNTKWTRWFLDDFLHTRMLYRALHASGLARHYMVQDLALPGDTVEEFVKYVSEEYDIWPLWLCPLKQSRRPTLHPHDFRNPPALEADGVTMKPMLNVGVWGEPKRRPPVGTIVDEYRKSVQNEKKLESKLLELGGMKWGYGKHFYDKDEFWSMFRGGGVDGGGNGIETVEWYHQLREKYFAHHLPTIHDKISVNVHEEEMKMKTDWKTKVLSIWPLGGIWALRKAIESKDYLLHRKNL
jgi:Delta24-sterol reductase